MTPPITFAIFDVDGTLVDSQQMILRCITASCDAMCIEYKNDRAQLLSGVGLPLLQALKSAVPALREDQMEEFVKLYKGFHRKFLDSAEDLQPPFPGVQQMLDALRAQGIKLGICTSKMRPGLDILLSQRGWDKIFCNIKTPDDGPGKPDPALLLMAMREEGVTPQQTIFIGDSTYDIEAGLAANVHVLGVAWGYHTEAQLQGSGASRIAQKMDDIIPMIRSLTKDAA